MDFFLHKKIKSRQKELEEWDKITKKAEEDFLFLHEKLEKEVERELKESEYLKGFKKKDALNDMGVET